MVDKIIHLELDKKVIGIKSVTNNEPFFPGHFPGQPIMPGVLIIEAMAQTGGIMLLNSFTDFNDKLVYFMQINNAKFRKPVVPGDTLYLEVEMVNRKSKIFNMKGRAFVNENLVAEAEFMAGVVDKDQKTNGM
jgi:UDP-3-O-[3-hydroxymyristoyl] N-acetylglucosamine deacetylase/3-hydroxyacyl-[acyl-carrier-protein] dehydratase